MTTDFEPPYGQILRLLVCACLEGSFPMLWASGIGAFALTSVARLRLARFVAVADGRQSLQGRY